MVIMGFQTPVPNARWRERAEHSELVAATHAQVIKRRQTAIANAPQFAARSSYHDNFVDPTSRPEGEVSPPKGNDFTSHRALRSCLRTHSRIVAPGRLGPNATSASAYGRQWRSEFGEPRPPPEEVLKCHAARRLLANSWRRPPIGEAPPPGEDKIQTRAARRILGGGRNGCKETAFYQTLLVSRRKPLDTQWQNHLHMADPPELAGALAQSSRSLW